MHEKLVKIVKSKRKNKKYKAIVRGRDGSERAVHFGDSRYGHYKDTTGVGAWSGKDHGDRKRRENYFQRHSGTRSKTSALKQERRKGRITARFLSHKFLW